VIGDEDYIAEMMGFYAEAVSVDEDISNNCRNRAEEAKDALN
jgi:hypothetical protein